MGFFHQLITSTHCRFTMTKMLHSSPVSCFQCSPFPPSVDFKNSSRKVSLSCLCTPIHPRVLRVKSHPKLSLIANHTSGTGSSSTLNIQHRMRPLLAFTPRNKLTIGFSHSIIPKNMLGDGSGSGAAILYNTAFGKKFYSKVSRPVTLKSDTVNVREASNQSNMFFKSLKQAKSLAAYGRNAIFQRATGKTSSISPISAAKDADKVTSNDKPLESKKEDVDLESLVSVSGDKPSKAKGRVKKQSRSKKGKEQVSDANASSLGSAVHSKASRKVSKTKSSLTKDNQSLMPLEIGSTANASTEVLENNISAKDSSKQARKGSSRQRRSSKEANSLESSEALAVQSGNDLLQNKRPHTSGTTKPLGQKTLPQLYPPPAKSVVVVESITKAKVIQGYLGGMYEVLPSYGHVRDLAARSGSVRPDDDFSMVWEVPSPAWTHLKSIKVALTGAKYLILASDPDREGEAIAWHIIEMLQQQDALHDNITVARVAFNQITESSIKSALRAPRHIDINLVDAYLARRALDYLIGFNISPLLWRKLPGCQSAGRVQSAALSLICDREMEIDEFKPQEYWTVEVKFCNSANSCCFSSQLTHFDSKKLTQLSIGSHVEAANVQNIVDSSNFKVLSSKRSKFRRNPPTPFITSTLQQEAANTLHFSAAYTMKLAQKLYEGIQLSDGEATGLITYMRTDGLHISDEAVKEIQSFIAERYGDNFTLKGARKYFKKVKNAQEAHEAIRPTDVRRLPLTLVGVLDGDSLKLYTLIWARTMACQMEPAIIDQIQLDVGNAGQSVIFRSTCSKMESPGYQAVNEDIETSKIRVEEDEANDRSEVFISLSNLKSGESLRLNKVELEQHFTQPPPRYSEGSLVKKLEELGIGRPSTYAITIKVLKDRKYVTAKGRTLYPEFRGRMVSAYLSHYFSEVTDYSFTADMETELDNVSAGLTEWKGLLKDYWTRFSNYCERASDVHIHQVEKMLEKAFGDFLFSSLPDGNRTCPSCLEGTLIFKVSRFGAGYFIGCDQHPKCKYIAKTLYGEDDEEITPEENNKNVEEPKLLGLSPGSNEKVLLKNGPYGYYVQLGEDRKGYLPKRASVSQIKDVDSITLEDALDLLRYPVTLGNHPDDGQPVILKLARFGFSIRHRRTIAPVPKNMKPSEITLEKALPLLLSKDVKRCGRPKRKQQLEEPIEAVM